MLSVGRCTKTHSHLRYLKYLTVSSLCIPRYGVKHYGCTVLACCAALNDATLLVLLALGPADCSLYASLLPSLPYALLLFLVRVLLWLRLLHQLRVLPRSTEPLATVQGRDVMQGLRHLLPPAQVIKVFNHQFSLQLPHRVLLVK